jgi:CMP-N,N'-diacetyllegionaminic acid synthase
MKTLFLIPARGGSKGLPGKNIKPLAGKPLINYAIDLARCFASDEDICLSTDNPEIAETAIKKGLHLPFIRPTDLSSNIAGSYEVMLHAIAHYEAVGKRYDTLILLQPTSPLRLKRNLAEAIGSYNHDLDMVVSVKASHSNPYWNLFKENGEGYLEPFFENTFTRRQDVPLAYAYNGAIYIINIDSLKRERISSFTRIKKTIMEDYNSVDIDTPLEFMWAEYLLSNKIVKLDY